MKKRKTFRRVKTGGRGLVPGKRQLLFTHHKKESPTVRISASGTEKREAPIMQYPLENF